MDRITPVRRPRGRAATKAHHRKPSQTVAVRAFASTAGRGKALLEYAAEMIKAGRIMSEEDLQRAVDGGAFGLWLNERATKRKTLKREIVAEVANPNWKPAAPAPKDDAVAKAGDAFRKANKEAKALEESYALKYDAERALEYCMRNRCPQDYAWYLELITSERRLRQQLKQAKANRK